jgi:hypothetical protein
MGSSDRLSKSGGFLIQEERLDDDEQKSLARTTSDELRKSLESLTELTPQQAALLQRLKEMPGTNVTGLVKSILSPKFPAFMYFSHYDRMVGAMRVDDIVGAGANRTHPRPNPQNQMVQQPLEIGEQVFLDFLELAGSSIEEIRASSTYESLNAKCEAASNAITDELREYWTQNPHLDIDIRITKAEPNDPNPLNEGVIARARVRNTVHRVSVPFSERECGLHLVLFVFGEIFTSAKVRGQHSSVVGRAGSHFARKGPGRSPSIFCR